jgi:hypothetical protein
MLVRGTGDKHINPKKTFPLSFGAILESCFAGSMPSPSGIYISIIPEAISGLKCPGSQLMVDANVND